MLVTSRADNHHPKPIALYIVATYAKTHKLQAVCGTPRTNQIWKKWYHWIRNTSENHVSTGRLYFLTKVEIWTPLVNNYASIALIFYGVEWGKTPILNFNGTYLVDYCCLRQFEGMVGDGPFNSLSTYNISQICNVSRYTKFVQNLCKNLAPVLSFAPVLKCSTGTKWASYSM